MAKKIGAKVYGLSGRSDQLVSIIYASWMLAFGSADAASFMFMLSRWYDKGSRDDGFIYKSIDDIETETGIKRRRQEAIKKSLIALDVITVQLLPVGDTRVLHYRLNQEKAQNLINKAEKELDNIASRR